MAKKKKTREQKILAAIHRKAQLEKLQHYSFTKKSNYEPKEQKRLNKQPEISSMQTFAMHPYRYLIRDLRKTLLVTVAIIAIQVILRAFVR